jgi:hypothetical protein
MQKRATSTRGFAASLLLAAAGCGGSVTNEGGSDAGVVDASLVDASLQDASGSLMDHAETSAPGCSGAGPSGTIGSPLSGRVPQNHRPSTSMCPLKRPASSPLLPCGCSQPEGGPCPCALCSQDSDCDAGVNGRCGNPEGAPFNYPGCSYDQRFSDSDCEAGVPCSCRASASDQLPKHCVTGGNCRVDGDCGSGGDCSPSLWM